MNYLAIDTSGKNLTVIIKKGDEVHSYFDAECGVNHSVNLMPRVEQLAEQAQFDLSQVDFFACVVGAGSFTGIRIGVATIKAMCFAYNKPCLSITSFDTLAYNTQGKVLAVIDAKHNGFYVCGYHNEKVVFEPSYIMKDQLLQLVSEYDKAVSSTVIADVDAQIVCVKDGLINAVECKKECVLYNIETLTPLYVRKSQAEEGR